MNLKKLREDNMVSKFNQFIENYGDKLAFPDQTTLNYVCNDKVGFLPSKYAQFTAANLEVVGELNKNGYDINYDDGFEGFTEPLIIHYYTSNKPWKANYKRGYANYFWYYTKKSGYFNEIYEIYSKSVKEFESKENNKKNNQKIKLISLISFASIMFIMNVILIIFIIKNKKKRSNFTEEKNTIVGINTETTKSQTETQNDDQIEKENKENI